MRLVLAAVALTALTTMNPSNATYAETGGGLTCGALATPAAGLAGLAGLNGPAASGQEGTQWRAVVTGGPWLAPRSHPDATVAIKCTLLVVPLGQPPQVVGEATSPPSPGGGVLDPTQTMFRMPDLAMLMLCTEVTVDWDGTPHVYHGDADHDPSNGAQCATAGPSGNEAAGVRVIPPDLEGGEICGYVDHPLPYPPVPHQVCF